MSKEVLLDEKSKNSWILSELSLSNICDPQALVRVIGERIPELLEDHSTKFEEKISICERLRKELYNITGQDIKYDILIEARKEIYNIDMLELSIFEKYNIFEKEFLKILPRLDSYGIDRLTPKYREIVLKGIKSLFKNKVKVPNSKKDVIFILYKELKEIGYKFSLLEHAKILFFAF